MKRRIVWTKHIHLWGITCYFFGVYAKYGHTYIKVPKHKDLDPLPHSIQIVYIGEYSPYTHVTCVVTKVKPTTYPATLVGKMMTWHESQYFFSVVHVCIVFIPRHVQSHKLLVSWWLFIAKMAKSLAKSYMNHEISRCQQNKQHPNIPENPNLIGLAMVPLQTNLKKTNMNTKKKSPYVSIVEVAIHPFSKATIFHKHSQPTLRSQEKHRWG